MFTTEERNLLFDATSGREIYDDAMGRVMSRTEVDDAIRNVCFEKLGLTEKSTDREIKRALKTPEAREFFNVIEEVLDPQISYWWKDNEFFNNYVETINIADGDRNEFWVQDEVLLNVSKVSGSNHDMSIQRLGSGTTYSVPTSVYGIKVGGDIRLFLTGRKNWSEFVNAVAKAYARKIQTEIYAEFANGTNLIPIPSKLSGTGALNSTTKPQFDALIEKVSAANECPVVIMGCKTALKNLNALTAIPAVDWISAEAKKDIYMTGVIGTYEGTPLVELPQRFDKKDYSTASTLVPTNVLYIMPLTDEKFVKFVDYGETSLEVSEIGATVDDMQSLEVQRRFGVCTIMTKYFAKWTI